MLELERRAVPQSKRKAVAVPTIDIRRKALALLAEQWGGPTNLAKKLDVTPSYVSQMLAGNRPITEKAAAKIEEKLGLATGFMSTRHTESPAPAPIDDELVTRVIMTVGEHAEEAGLILAPSKFAEVVTLVYEEATRTRTIDEAYIARVLKLLRS